MPRSRFKDDLAISNIYTESIFDEHFWMLMHSGSLK